MKYSVWNNASRRYDYYQAQGDARIHAGAPPRASTTELGATPEQAAWPLPASAVKVGSGDLPEGRIASTLPAGTYAINFKESIVYGIIGYLLWKAIKS
jgi:hypothetical protein